MSHLVVDDLADLTPWAARTPTGAASAAITLARSPAARLGGPALRIEAGPDATGHRIERALGPLDLSPFDDLELWVRGDRAADGSDGRPFYLELRLGSAALAVGASGNAWQRLIPVDDARKPGRRCRSPSTTCRPPCGAP